MKPPSPKHAIRSALNAFRPSLHLSGFTKSIGYFVDPRLS
jgi:hypothetical protein